MQFVTLHTAEHSFEANFIKENLLDEGIQCILTNENFTSLMPHLNGILGSGVQILVDKEDYDRARGILDKRNAYVEACPNCNSKNIGFGLGTKHRIKRLIAIAIAMIIGSPIRHIRQTYYCKDCKTEFGK